MKGICDAKDRIYNEMTDALDSLGLDYEMDSPSIENSEDNLEDDYEEFHRDVPDGAGCPVFFEDSESKRRNGSGTEELLEE